MIELTTAGRAKFAAIQQDVHAMEDELLSTLGAAERKALRTALPRLADT